MLDSSPAFISLVRDGKVQLDYYHYWKLDVKRIQCIVLDFLCNILKMNTIPRMADEAKYTMTPLT
jgi:hypothetical protein